MIKVDIKRCQDEDVVILVLLHLSLESLLPIVDSGKSLVEGLNDKSRDVSFDVIRFDETGSHWIATERRQLEVHSTRANTR